jgi:lysine-specific demethylase 8
MQPQCTTPPHMEPPSTLLPALDAALQACTAPTSAMRRQVREGCGLQPCGTTRPGEAARAAVQVARVQLYALPYHQVGRDTRQRLACAMLAEAVAEAAAAPPPPPPPPLEATVDSPGGTCDPGPEQLRARRVLALVDTAWLMTACPGMEGAVGDWMDRLSKHLQHLAPTLSPLLGVESPAWDVMDPPALPAPFPAAGYRELTTFTAETAPSTAAFLRDLVDRPFLVRGGCAHWPACSTRPWRDLGYLSAHGPHRLVPVELGRKYTDGAWTQQLLPFHELLQRVSSSSSSSSGDDDDDDDDAPLPYLAQHDLHATFPALRNDISIPDYCYVMPPLAAREEAGETGQVTIHHWIGPAGTHTPLHYDRYRNLFAQVCGYKVVRLYAPDAPVHPYPRDSLLFNTSRVDVDALVMGGEGAGGCEPLQRFPDLHAVPYHQVLVGPGDVLYIPHGWWHWVRSLSPSISVSLWC